MEKSKEKQRKAKQRKTPLKRKFTGKQRRTFTSRRLCVVWRCPLIHDSLRDSETQRPPPSPPAALLKPPMNDHCPVVCGGGGCGGKDRVVVALAADDWNWDWNWDWAAMRESSSAIRRWDDIMSSKPSIPNGSLLPPKGHPKDAKGDLPNGNGNGRGKKKSSLLLLKNG
jgi:hypothetical protein